ncbi:MAG: ankyrin repeat and MYND domain-containing protein [Candidatus Dependentiae bacterium]|nr:ankyrin repeat and MYND domain-containing protein [Candidatus Dependentiae bacterium]
MKTILIRTLLLTSLIGCTSPYLMAAKKKQVTAKKTKLDKNLELLMKAWQQKPKPNYHEIQSISLSDSDFRTFFEAVENNNIKLIKSMLREKPMLAFMGYTNETEQDPTKKLNYSTALILAAEHQTADTLTALLNIPSIDANINLQKESGETALMMAAGSGNKNKVTLLLEKNADSEIKNIQGATALMIAIIQNHKEIFDILLPLCKDIHAKTRNGQTILSIAKQHSKNKYMTEKIIQAGARDETDDSSSDIDSDEDDAVSLWRQEKAAAKEKSAQRNRAPQKLCCTLCNHENNPTNLTCESCGSDKSYFVPAQPRESEIHTQPIELEREILPRTMPLTCTEKEAEEKKDEKREMLGNQEAPVATMDKKKEKEPKVKKDIKKSKPKTCIACGNIQPRKTKECMTEASTNQTHLLFRLCGGCPKSQKAYYCSTLCQHNDWNTHKETCARLDKDQKDDSESVD